MNKKFMLAALPLVIFIGLCVVFYWGLQQDPRALETVRQGKPVPDFSLPSLKNPEHIISTKDLPSEPYLLNVWATWCSACYQEHPYLVKFAKQYPYKWIGVNYKDKTRDALKYLQDGGEPYVYSVADKQGILAIDLGVYGAPETFIVDGNGIIRERHVGVINDRVWSDKILPLMKKLEGEL